MSAANRKFRPGRFAGTVLLFLTAACAPTFAPVPMPPLPASEDGGAATHTAYVVSNGWHTGIVLARGDVPAGLLPEIEDFPAAPYIEFGWGDREYYPSADPTIGIALGAALVPSPAIMHVAGLYGPPRAATAAGQEAVAIAMTRGQVARLAASIDAWFERPSGERADSSGSGLYPGSRFYPAHGRFHLFNTCNTWTARQLVAGGVGISLEGVVTAESVMRQLRIVE